jgi:hypothetical protein
MPDSPLETRFDPSVTFRGAWYGDEAEDPQDASLCLEDRGSGASLLLHIKGPGDEMVSMALDDFNAAIAFLLHEPASSDAR